MVDFNSCLHFAKEKLGFTFDLKEEQESVLRSLFEGKDVVTVLPTGYGKSLVFQLLPFIFEKKAGLSKTPIVIVVCPLNSIMQDQVQSLGKRGIPACFLNIDGNSANTFTIDVTRDISEENSPDVIFSNIKIDEVASGRFCLLYAHPETLLDNKEIGRILRSPLFQDMVCATVIDEVHMISEWGKDFRTSFSKLGQLTSIFPCVPHLALTATASHEDVDKLCETLDFIDAIKIIKNPDRPNIFISVQQRLPNIKKFEKLEAILKLIGDELIEKRETFPVTIVYCDNLESVGFSYRYMEHMMGDQAYCSDKHIPENRMFAQYHKDYTGKMKRYIVSELGKENPQIRLIFATVALGMGLNSPSIIRIIHMRPPTSLEKYLQEIGRAGRSGQTASALMYFNNNDIAANRKGLDTAMRSFVLNETSCLRLHLLKYFGFGDRIYSGPPELCCINCKNNKSTIA